MEDYTSVNEVIQFDLGDERKVYNLRITEDQRCEDILESFNIDLFLYEGIVPVIKSTAQVFIRDTRCGKYYYFPLCIYFSTFFYLTNGQITHEVQLSALSILETANRVQ